MPLAPREDRRRASTRGRSSSGDTGLIRTPIDSWLGLNELARDVSLMTLTPAGGGESLASRFGVEALVKRAEALGLDPHVFREALECYIAAARDGDFSVDQPRALIAQRRAAVRDELAALPASIEKCETFLRALADAGDLDGSDNEAYADPAVDLRNQQRQALAEYWRKQWQEHREHRDLVSDEAFWVSADFQDRYDDIAYYRAYERYELGEFDELFDDVAKRIGEGLVEELAAGDVFGRFPATSAYHAFGLAENAWLVSRSRRLRLRLHAQALAAISSLFFAQRQEGWWPAPVTGEGGSHPPSVQATAMAVIAGLRISTDEEHRQQVEQAVTWLIGSQQAGGSWAGIDGQADVMATALALEAITISRRTGSADVADRAVAWLLAQQQPHGTWQGDLPTTLATITVVSALRRAGSAGQQIPSDLAAGLALLRRAQILGLERSTDARQLAVIAAYTAIEAILYALLAHPDLDIATVRANGLAIGFDEALIQYEAALVELGRLDAGKHVGGHSTLRSLTHVRDGVVHRGTQPSAVDTHRILAAVGRLVREQVPAIFGFDPTDDQ
jgi:Squalene-hopene cyclase C-terminal domain